MSLGINFECTIKNSPEHSAEFIIFMSMKHGSLDGNNHIEQIYIYTEDE